jgi:hypothetical protein
VRPRHPGKGADRYGKSDNGGRALFIPQAGGLLTEGRTIPGILYTATTSPEALIVRLGSGEPESAITTLK